MQRFWDIAPPLTWGLLAVAAICLLCAFVLLSHSLVRLKAYEERWKGWMAGGRLESTIRGGLTLLLAGGLLWAVTLEAPQVVLWGLGAGGLLFAGLQAMAMRRGRS